KEAVRGHDAVVNLATHIPPMSQMTRISAWAENDRIRREVSRNLVDAALEGGAARYVQESIAFMYADGGDAWLDEDSPVDAPSYVHSAVEAEAQARRFTEQGRTGVALRFGGFYCTDSEQSRVMVGAARAGIAAIMGS